MLKLTKFLFPLSFLWSLFYRVRRFLYTQGLIKRANYDIPVISVGNLSFGGTGKTPLVLHIAKKMEDKGLSVLIATRGHGAELVRTSGVMETSKNIFFDPFKYGDEPTLMATHLKRSTILVGKKRYKNLNDYLNKHSADVILLDDGHQHLQIERDLDIVLVDVGLPVKRMNPPPIGYLREGISAIESARIVLYSKKRKALSDEFERIQSMVEAYLLNNAYTGGLEYKPTGLFNLDFQYVHDTSYLKGKKLILFSGIANPEHFFESVEGPGVDIFHTQTFPDHYKYKEDEFDSLIKMAQTEGAIILCTEKDAVKVRGLVDSELIFFLGIELDFMGGEKKFWSIIDNVLAQKGVSL